MYVADLAGQNPKEQKEKKTRIDSARIHIPKINAVTAPGEMSRTWMTVVVRTHHGWEGE